MIYLIIIIKILLIIVAVLISVAYLTLAERKVLAVVQRRKGPNVIGAYGLLQPLADGFKLLMKEAILPSNSNEFIFKLSPMLSFIVSLIGWSIIPFGEHGLLADLHIGLLFLLGFSSLGIYGIVSSGWSSNSKYAFLGSLRSTAQMISYEVSIGFSIIAICLISGSFNINRIIISQTYTWYFFPLFLLAIIFFISGLAETNRHPFDLPEAEAELVSGYNVEYSGMSFALFSLAEYSNILIMSSLNVILFWGGWLTPTFFPFCESLWFSIKISIFLILFILMRAILPRYRYDQLMFLGWKIFLPITLSYVLFIICIIKSFELYPL